MVGLTIFDNSMFNIIDDNDELREIPNKDILQKFHYVASKKFHNVLVHWDTYKDLKKDVEDMRFQKWFNNEAIDFVACWLMQDFQSPMVDASEIVSSLVSNQVQTLFRFAQKDEGQFRFAMSQIDLYLSTHLDILAQKLCFLYRMKKICIGGAGFLLIPGC